MMSARRGRTWDQVALGDEFQTGHRTISQDDVAQFANLSGDTNPLHTDEEFAKTTSFGKRIAHGVLVLAVATGLANQFGLFDGTTLAFLEIATHWAAPTFPGDTLRLVLIVASKSETSKPDRGIVGLQVRALNQTDAVVMESTWTMLIRRSEAAPPA
jgi:acyl dehydratase